MSSLIAPLYNSTLTTLACNSSSIPFPSIYGAEILSFTATPVVNFSESIHAGLYINHGTVSVDSASFCNVSITYTHPGQNDSINAFFYLPSASTWNSRLQAFGGGGWQAGLTYASLNGMLGGVGEGYASMSTDAGLGNQDVPTNWALLSPGNVNLYALQNLASVSLNDLSLMGKALTESYYGVPPKFSYFTGCSQGGRQGMMLAQRYPDAFDGIAASAPAINWNEFVLEAFWPSFQMRQQGVFPPSCELDAITSAALAACDGLDGVTDGVITDPDSCPFDAMSVVGTTFNCSNFGTEFQISSGAATLMNSVWAGPKAADNTSIWFGLPKGAMVTGTPTDMAIMATTCSSNGTCVATDLEIGSDWIKLFLLRDSSFNMSSLTNADFESLVHVAKQQYDSIIGTNDPDLSAFKARSGKLLGYHGTSDSIIPHEGSSHYYDAVTALDSDVHDFYRLFMAPGLTHCFGGVGAYPDGTFDAMRRWVEDNVVPEILNATSIVTSAASPQVIERILCPYPQKQVYDGTGDGISAVGYSCVD
ncbi:hypothetical protein ACEPPN_018361 [Leptodophora sp. 'Broadleaf-Isolate-01']